MRESIFFLQQNRIFKANAARVERENQQTCLERSRVVPTDQFSPLTFYAPNPNDSNAS